MRLYIYVFWGNIVGLLESMRNSFGVSELKIRSIRMVICEVFVCFVFVYLFCSNSPAVLVQAMSKWRVGFNHVCMWGVCVVFEEVSMTKRARGR